MSNSTYNRYLAFKNGLEHLECAWANGFTPLTVGCPVIIADGVKGTDDILVPVEGGEYVKEAKVGRAVMDADIIISLSHFKGHEEAGFGGCIKNIGMGCGSRAGKAEMHNYDKPEIDEKLCRGCNVCKIFWCARAVKMTLKSLEISRDFLLWLKW